MGIAQRWPSFQGEFTRDTIVGYDRNSSIQNSADVTITTFSIDNAISLDLFILSHTPKQESYTSNHIVLAILYMFLKLRCTASRFIFHFSKISDIPTPLKQFNLRTRRDNVAQTVYRQITMFE